MAPPTCCHRRVQVVSLLMNTPLLTVLVKWSDVVLPLPPHLDRQGTSADASRCSQVDALASRRGPRRADLGNGASGSCRADSPTAVATVSPTCQNHVLLGGHGHITLPPSGTQDERTGV